MKKKLRSKRSNMMLKKVMAYGTYEGGCYGSECYTSTCKTSGC